MKRLLFLLLVAITFGGCTKNKDFFEFELRVIDNNGNAVSGATVTAFVQAAGLNGSNEPFTPSGTFTSDGAGRINIQVDKQSVFAYRFDISKTGFYGQEIFVDPDDVPFTRPYEGDLQINGQSWIDLHLINQNSSIALFFSVDADAPECDDCCDGTQEVRTGFVVDEHFVCSMYSDQDFEVSGFVTDSANVVNPYSHTFTSTQGDTIQFLLSY